MIPAGVKIFLASHPIDFFRKGPDSLLSLVRDAGSDPSTARFMSSGRNGHSVLHNAFLHQIPGNRTTLSC